jgi:hypothetical protein
MKRTGIVTLLIQQANSTVFSFRPAGQVAEEEYEVSRRNDDYDNVVRVVEYSYGGGNRPQQITITYVTRDGTSWVQAARRV